jgi:hypothetical protein
VGLVVHEVAMEQVSLRFLWSSLVNVITAMSRIHSHVNPGNDNGLIISRGRESQRGIKIQVRVKNLSDFYILSCSLRFNDDPPT